MDTVSIALLQVESSDSSIWAPGGSVSMASAYSTTYFVVCLFYMPCMLVYFLDILSEMTILRINLRPRLFFQRGFSFLLPEPEVTQSRNKTWGYSRRPQSQSLPHIQLQPFEVSAQCRRWVYWKEEQREAERRKGKRQGNVSLYTGWRWAWVEMKPFTLGRVLSHRQQNCLWQIYSERKFSKDIIWRAKMQGRVQGGCVACVHSKGGHEGQRTILAFLGPCEDLDSCCICPVGGEFLKKRKGVQILSRQTE